MRKSRKRYASCRKRSLRHAERIRVTVKSGGHAGRDAPSAPQHEIAEFDAWYVFWVDKVDNRMEVRP